MSLHPPVVGVVTVPLALWSVKTPTSVAGFFSRKASPMVGVLTVP